MTPSDIRELIQRSGQVRTTYLGTRTSRLGVEQNVGIPDDKRLLHTLVVGPTGYGKSQVMVHAALQDAHKGRGFCLINPKGDAIDELLAKLPTERHDDLLYLNPAGEDVPAINVLDPHVTPAMNAAQRENQKEIIVADVIDLFRRQSENWGDRFGRVLETLLRAHLDLNIAHGESNSLIDVFECVVQPEELTALIDRTPDPVVREQLVRIKEDMGSYELEPLQRRLNDFVMNPTIRRLIGGDESSIDFRAALDRGRIVLVDVQKGEVGETVSRLVGSLVITQVWAAAQSRITQAPGERDPFYLYVDELQNFAGEGSNFTTILSEAREYGLGCWLVTQYLKQLATEMRRAVTNNCRTKIIFNPVGSDDVSQVASMLVGLDRTQLTALGKYRAAVQLPGNRERPSATVLDTYPPWDADRGDVAELQARHAVAGGEATIEMKPGMGAGANSGGERHAELLTQAKERLEARGLQVNLLYQDAGEDKPDGHVVLPDDSVAHLEAEQSTLSKPAKVLTNLRRAAEQDRECIFVVEAGKAAKLANIVSDPVNRRGEEHSDEQGSYAYYTGDGGEPFTDVEAVADAEYRIVEVGEDELTQHDDSVEMECPELDHSAREELTEFCLYRDEHGFCTELETECVLLEDG